MRRHVGWVLMGLGCWALEVGAWLLDRGASLAPIPTPPGMEERIMRRLREEEEARRDWLIKAENWRDRA